MRKELSGSVKYNKQDFHYLKGITDICRHFEYRETKVFAAPVGEVTIFTGRFTLLNCAFSDDKCEVVCDVEPFDNYTCLLQNWDKKFNVAQVVDLTQVWEVETGAIIEFGVGVGTIATPPTSVVSNGPQTDPLLFGDYVESIANSSGLSLGYPSVIVDMMIYCRELVQTPCVNGVPQQPDGSGWVLDSAFCTPNGGYSIWARRFDYTPFGSFDLPIGVWDENVQVIPIAVPIPAPPPVWAYMWDDGVDKAIYNIDSLVAAAVPLQSRYIKGARTLEEVTNAMLQANCGAGQQMSSNFFTDTLNPVTGQPNVTANLQIWTKSDIANAQLTDPLAQASLQASDVKMTVRELLGDMNTHFNVNWWIDENIPNIVRIEHVSDARPQTVGFDLTVYDGGKWLINQNEYKYKSEGVPIQEQWNQITANLPDFVGLPIDYEGCGGDPIIYNTNQIDTEITVLLGDEENRGVDGFLFVQPDSLKSTDSLAEVGLLFNFFQPNMPLALTRLHDRFWKYMRKLPKGKLNNVSQTFISYERTQQQKTFSFKLCNPNDLPLQELVTTNYGDCEIVSTSYNKTHEMMTITLDFNL
jgi:hypothetical protein